MIIRSMQEKDLQAVHEIECGIFSRPWSIEDFHKSIKEDKSIYLVVEEKEEITAYCGLWDVAGEGQINNVAVKKNARNQGVGYAMLKKLIELGSSQGVEAFTLEVRISNLSAISLYHKLGFKDAGIRKKFYESPAEDALIMWLH